MLSPEVWSFSPPKTEKSLVVDISQEKNTKQLLENPFYHNIFLVFADTSKDIPDQIKDTFKDGIYYKLSNVPLSELFERDFLDGYVKKGSLSCLSIDIDANVDNIISITDSRDFNLILNADTYHKFGINGKKLKRKNNEFSFRKYEQLLLKGIFLKVVWCNICNMSMNFRKMPNIKQPRTLEDLSLTALADWVAQIGSDMMPVIDSLSRADSNKAQLMLAISVKSLKDLLDFSIPWMLYDKFAEEIFRSVSDLLERTKKNNDFRIAMSKLMIKMNVGVSMVEVLLTRNLTKLNIDEVPQMMRHLFYTKFSNLNGLQVLNLGSLSGGWKTADMEPTIIAGLKSLSRLKDLTIYYDCTDNVLKAICESCPKLQALDVTSSKSITNESVKYLINCRELRRVQLYRTGVSLEGFTKLLLYSSNMEDVGRCDELGKVLEYIDLTNSTAGPFALRKYVSRNVISAHLQLLVRLCPLVYSVSLFHNPLFNDLTLLIGLPEMRELKLLSCDFFADQIKQVLEVKGCNLSSLHLEHVDQLDMNALMYISQFCSGLKTLTLYNCVLVQHTSLYTRKVDWYPFYNLEKLVCVCEGTEEQMFFLLSNCFNIRHIHLGTACRTSDRLFDNVMVKNSFLFLEELRILQSEELTMKTVSQLLSTCGKLRVLTELECWTGLTDSDMVYIRDYIKINNLDLDICPKHINFSLSEIQLRSGTKLHKRVYERSKQLNNLTLIISWEPFDDSVCPSSIAKYFDSREINVEECEASLSVRKQHVSLIPSLDVKNVDSIIEWIGMIAVNGEINPEEDFVSKYSVGCAAREGFVIAFNINGFFTSNFIVKLLKELRKNMDGMDICKWYGLSLQSFTDAPKNKWLSENKCLPQDDTITLLYNDKNNILSKCLRLY